MPILCLRPRGMPNSILWAASLPYTTRRFLRVDLVVSFGPEPHVHGQATGTALHSSTYLQAHCALASGHLSVVDAPRLDSDDPRSTLAVDRHYPEKARLI